MSRFARVALVLALVGLGWSDVRAGALQVSPLGIRLTDQNSIATLRVRNVDARQVIMQADVFAWTQPDGEDAYAATDRIVVIPPIFSLAPGAQQLLRVGLPDALPTSDVERAFRVFLHELRPIEQQSDGQLNLALRIGLPIFVPPPADAPAGELRWHLVRAEEGSSTLRLSNRSAEHVKVTSIRFLAQDGSLLDEVRMLRYCLPGADAMITLPASDRAQQIADIQVIFKSGEHANIESIAFRDDTSPVR